MRTRNQGGAVLAPVPREYQQYLNSHSGEDGGTQCISPQGISIVICSHNGASRLPEVLKHLALQDPASWVAWEVIVVNNASTDNTADVARQSIALFDSVPLRIVNEPRLGLSFAKQRGIEEARYEFVAFVDDDSWLCPGWIQAAAEVCSQHPEAGTFRGIIEAVCEEPPPSWFESQREWYGVWPDIQHACDVTDVAGGICGDGMILRKTAWRDLRAGGFEFTMTGNIGAELGGSEDQELSLALRLAGWRFWYEPRLRLQQTIESDKLTWRHLRRRARNAGVSSVYLDPYYVALHSPKRSGSFSLKTAIERLPGQWLWRALWTLKELVPVTGTLLLMGMFELEGRDQVLVAETAKSRIRRLLQMRSGYDRMVRRAGEKQWHPRLSR